ncbi:myelin-associated glycoprotein-like [Gadus macrocephalus]|uniref:myelin-associated glycoprotein-like n=1 Tax=Gadus macrocephalus TaxID=80720 RepID=UPI0028CBB96A|nr:myelin-associated glycoprotein-like [Gadus macrocephalus]
MSRDTTVLLGWLLLQATSCTVWSADWNAKVVREVDALVDSCVVIPCSFTYGEGLSRATLKGSWFPEGDKEKYIFQEDIAVIMREFRGRTELTGRLTKGNCTLKIIEVKDHDDGPFCFKVEMSDRTLKTPEFENHCARLNLLAEPPKPKLNPPRKAIQGEPYTISCSVAHTCPAHRPNITWSRASTDTGVIHINKDNGKGSWEMESILTFIPEATDDDSELSCTATFNGGVTSSSTHHLFVKRKELYLHIILPLVVGLGTAVVFGALCVLMKIKYKNRIADLQSRGNGRLRNHLSRISQRMSSSRFMPSRPREPVDLSAYDMPNNTAKKQKISKPRCPSPKSQPGSFSNRGATGHDRGFGDSCDDDYTNTADLNIYGNL